MDLTGMWIMTFVGISVVLFLLVASTAFRCLSSNSLASVLQIGSLVIFTVTFAVVLIVWIGGSNDTDDNLQEFTRKAKKKAQSLNMRLIANNVTRKLNVST